MNNYEGTLACDTPKLYMKPLRERLNEPPPNKSPKEIYGKFNDAGQREVLGRID